jgi:carbamoyltransferase
MRILGVSCHYHDAAAALLVDGALVAAAQEERFSRRKHDPGFPALAIDFCLRQAGCTAADLDYVVFYEKPFLKFERLFLTLLHTYPQSWRVFQESMLAWLVDKLWIKSGLQEHLKLRAEQILFVE